MSENNLVINTRIPPFTPTWKRFRAFNLYSSESFRPQKTSRFRRWTRKCSPFFLQNPRGRVIFYGSLFAASVCGDAGEVNLNGTASRNRAIVVEKGSIWIICVCKYLTKTYHWSVAAPRSAGLRSFFLELDYFFNHFPRTVFSVFSPFFLFKFLL